jgi:adenylosuccinate lyase
MESIALWHERDITHSSAERIIIPDSCILLDYMVATMAEIIGSLNVYPENMKKNLALTRGLVFSESVLLALTGKGMSREDAYAAVQEDAMKAWNSTESFREILNADRRITRLLKEGELDELFDLGKSTRHVDYIFARVGLK